MIVVPKQCYDIDELTVRNMHIHLAPFSRCASPEMRVSDVIDECERQGYEMIAFTNHFHDMVCPVITDTVKIRRAASRKQTDMKILFGAELSAVGGGQALDSNEQNACLDYRLYACNHYHQCTWLQPNDRSMMGYVKHCLENTELIIRSGRADAVAHPLHGNYIYETTEEKDLFVSLYTEDMIAEVMTMAKQFDVAWELNTSVVARYPELHRAFWNIGREVGVTFVFGSDAHSLAALNRKNAAEILKSVLV